MKRRFMFLCAAGVLCFALLASGFAPVRWVDFAASEWALNACLKADKEFGETTDYTFADGVAYLAATGGNRFARKDDEKNYKRMADAFAAGKSLQEIYPTTPYAEYLRTCYRAVLSPMVGAYKDEAGKLSRGLRCCFPLAAGYGYTHYDDFGSARSYGYKRRHLGHDIMGAVGTPVVACEGGVVTECGWNRYGGWRVGIRSHDTLRYWYYAHLRKDRPFASGVQAGAEVKTGQIIGFLGVTGYSQKENVNLTTCRPHLHLGLQLIFSPEQEKGAKEIWIDLYALTRFLAQYRVRAVKGADGEPHTERLRFAV